MNSFRFLSIFILVFLITSCKKTTEEYNQAFEDQALASSLFDEVKEITDQAHTTGNVNSYSSGKQDTTGSSCAIVSLDTTGIDRAIVIDFGNTGCLGADGRTRKGVIRVSFTGRYREIGTIITHTFEDYFVDEHEIIGTKTVTNTSGTVFNIVVSGTIIKADNQGTITWNSNRIRTWTQGSETILNWLDDVYHISGTSSGTNINDQDFTLDITEDLIIKLSCPRHPVQGKLSFQLENKRERVLDYGNGTCDNDATISVGNVTLDIEL